MGLIKQYLRNDRIFFGLLILEIIFFSWLNGRNEMMSGIMPYYENFAAYFASGFDLDFSFRQDSSTFPMWGYGLIPLLFGGKAWLVVALQQALSLFVIYRADKWLQEVGNEKSFIYFRIFSLLGICWWVFGSVLWPYSLAANFMVLNVIYLCKAYQDGKVKWVIIAALLAGLMLNLRSDYLYLIGVISLLLPLYFFRKGRSLFIASLSYPLIVLLALLPWAIHSKAWTGQYSLTSSNSGHVFYISLGQLPGNPWGITPVDGDPAMRNIIDEQIGPDEITTSPAATKVLMKAWKENVKDHPGAYVRKVGWAATQIFMRPFSTGQHFRRFYSDEQVADTKKNELKQSIRLRDPKMLINQVLTPANWGFLIDIFIGVLNAVLFLVFTFTLFKLLLKNGLRLFKDFGLTLFFAVIGYQLTMLLLVYYNGNYNTNVYLFYALLAAVTFSGQYHLLTSRPPSNMTDSQYS